MLPAAEAARRTGLANATLTSMPDRMGTAWLLERVTINDFCPQTLMLYGTYKSDGTPDFALFTWMSYYWNAEDDALGFTAIPVTETYFGCNGHLSAGGASPSAG